MSAHLYAFFSDLLNARLFLSAIRLVGSTALFAGSLTLTLGCDRAPLASERIVSVTGSCFRQVSPDRAGVTVTSVYREAEVQDAIKKATREYETLRDRVKNTKLENLELETSEYNVQEIREWENQKLVPKGYQARIGLNIVTSEIDKIGDVLAVASKLGIQEVGSLQNFLSDEAELKEREAWLADAVRNARAKAEAIAEAGEAKVGRLLSVHEDAGMIDPPPQPMHMQRTEMAMADSSETQAPGIEAGQQKISVQIQATFSLQ